MRWAARARTTGVSVDLDLQVQDYLVDDFGGAKPGATHVIFIGGNDIRDALAAGGDPAIIVAAVNAVADNIVTMYFAGATRFVVVNGASRGRSLPEWTFPDQHHTSQLVWLASGRRC